MPQLGDGDGREPTSILLAAVIVLGFVVLGCLGSAVALRFAGKDAPGELWAFAGTALGGVVGLLAPLRKDGT